MIDAEAWRQRLGFDGGEQNTNSEVIAETFEAAGAYVMGRRMADGGPLSPELRVHSGKEAIELTPARVIATPDVTHIRYRVNGRRPLVLDDRGQDTDLPPPEGQADHADTTLAVT